MSAGDKWVDRRAGPVVRPYALTAGRTEPAGGQRLDLITVVVASGPAGKARRTASLTPEQRRIVALCGEPATVADIASGTGLPVGVVRVLLADLIEQQQVAVLPQSRGEEPPSADLLREVLHGLRAL